MRWLLGAWCAAGVVAATGEDPPAPAADPFAGLPPAEAAVERLLSERGDPAAFEQAVAEACKQGTAEQVILEARFLYHVDRREDAAVAALLPKFLARRDTFRLEESQIFALREDWLAVVEYVQALAALHRGDHDQFKRHITEAFWLSPRQGAAFAPHIDRLRLDEAMKRIHIDFATKLRVLDGDGERDLAAILGDRKALVLHFWSPWSRECEESAADFATTARTLDAQHIAVASVLAEDDPQVLDDARKFVRQDGGLPGHWLRDRASDPLHAILRVQNVPVLVLLATDGRVLFNGHPADDACWQALRAVAPELKRPALDARKPAP
jgi:hypothetical protein